MKRIKAFFAVLVFTFGFAGPLVAVASPVVTTAGAACDGRLLGIPPWYRGLTVGADENCVVRGPDPNNNMPIEKYVTILALNIIEIGVVIVAYIALFFILYGGFQFLVGGGNSGTIEKARHSVLNAVIGLAIALGAVAILNLIFWVVE